MERLDRRTFVGRSAGYLLGGTLAAVPHRSSAAEVLRLATIPLDAGAEVYYALEMGFFRDAGIDAQIQSIPNGAAIAAAVASNAIDVGFSNLISLGEAYKRNVPFTVIAPGSLWSVKAPTTVLMVPKDSTVRRARDLNGKTIGVNGLKNILQYGAQAWIDRNGGDSSTVHFIEMTFPQTLEGLRTKRIDAGLVAEPFIEVAKADARILAPALDAVAPNLLIGCYFTTKAWAAAHPDLVARFALVIEKTAAWANAHQRQSGLILMKYSKLDPRTLQTMLRVVYATRFDISEMQPVIDVAAKYGGLSTSFPVAELVYRG
jgi:NitT/TauT family transport system substrate-binding protein